MKKRVLKVILTVAAVLAVAGLYCYLSLPAISLHAGKLWFFVFFILLIAFVIYLIRMRLKPSEVLHHRGAKIFLIVIAAYGVVYLVGALASSPIFNAKKYQKLLKVENGTFTKDVEEVSFDRIPLLDRDSAAILGNRKMGSMVDMVSQFEVDDIYSQINYQDKPVRVSPLQYASFIKWITNRSNGIPAYIKIDMATQSTELVKLKEGIRYSMSEHFNRNIYRHLRFRYPAYIFNDLSFEIDEEGTPYWVCPVKKFNIGLFGGVTIGKVVLCNAVDGSTKCYDIKDVPQWVDRCYSADLLVQLYDYYGTLKHGYINSVFGQKDCLVTTEGYNYLAIDDDVWVYTGVTSITGDQSNVGFVLMNQRTMETKYYEVEGATEYSAMDSAEGQVQNLKYEATFPLLLNIGGEPTYFIALKDNAGLVKKYAMVNVQKYQVVAIGDTVAECREAYLNLMVKEGINTQPAAPEEALTVTGRISRLIPTVIEGDSHYYVMLEGADEIYDADVADIIDIIRYDVGQEITFEYEEAGKLRKVKSIVR